MIGTNLPQALSRVGVRTELNKQTRQIRDAFLLAFLTIFAFAWFLGGMMGWKSYANSIAPTAELAFNERSLLGERAGSVVPASCNSEPPTSHFIGDCPPVVKLYVGPSGKTVAVNMWARTDLGAGWVEWTSTGATRCFDNWTFSARPLSGTVQIDTIYSFCPYETKIFKIRCENDEGFEAYSSVAMAGQGACFDGGA